MKKIIIIVLLFSAVFVQAQDKKQKGHVNSFSIKTNSIESLKDFDWRSLKKFFAENAKNDSIEIKFCLENENTEEVPNKFNANSSAFSIKGQTHELKKMIRFAKKMSKNIKKINKELDIEL